jgi:GDP-4-dehydro-6-deoxy-D-mannose reductase
VSDVVLVTGASGFAGGHLLQLLNAPQRVVGWTRSAPAPELEPLARWEYVDVLDRERVRTAVARLRPTQVYHCAGVAHVADLWRDTTRGLEGNVLGTEHLLDALRRAGQPCRVLVTGSAMVYAPSNAPIGEDHALAPASPYALSKLAQEELARRSLREDGLDVIIARAFNHTGARQTPAFAAPSMARQIAMIETGRVDPVIRVGNLEAHRDLCDVRDVVRAYAALMERATPNTVYNVASGTARAIRSLLGSLVARSKVPVRIETDPARMRPSDVRFLAGDFSRLERTTGWRPQISFDQMLDDLLAYWRAQAREVTKI